jgi:hypothetical protein
MNYSKLSARIFSSGLNDRDWKFAQPNNRVCVLSLGLY